MQSIRTYTKITSPLKLEGGVQINDSVCFGLLLVWVTAYFYQLKKQTNMTSSSYVTNKPINLPGHYQDSRVLSRAMY